MQIYVPYSNVRTELLGTSRKSLITKIFTLNGVGGRVLQLKAPPFKAGMGGKLVDPLCLIAIGDECLRSVSLGRLWLEYP
jgi:hypothetical protein